MKSNFTKFVAKFGGLFAALAVVIASVSANTTCMWISHQPELPDDVKKLRKF
ncbi:cyclic lactone autoinducer peptide [Porcipelethomonas sp.]|uniref:cyclic lactone autoinducer peptide n=1 Tax=Porcipelethomonas sp. TaxID=2981675 RepID=UPI003EF697F5